MRAWRADEWPEVRAAGKPRFLVRHGFLGRGLPLGVLIALVVEMAIGSPLPEALRSPLFLLRLVAFVALFTLTGCMRANVLWNACERRFSGHA